MVHSECTILRITMDLGPKLKEVRRYFSDMTQEGLAQKLGVKKSHISMVERGERGLSCEQLENLVNRLKMLEAKVRPGSEIDQLANRVSVNATLRKVVQKIAYLDAGMLEKIDTMVYGYVMGREDEKGAASENQNAGPVAEKGGVRTPA